MKFTITYTDDKTGEHKRLEIEPRMSVVGIEIPPQPDEELPGLKVDVNTDAVLIHSANGVRLSMEEFSAIVTDAQADGYDPFK